MKNATLLAALASASVLVASLPAAAAEWHKGPAGHRFSGDPVTAARAFLDSHAADLQIDTLDLRQQRVLSVHTLRTVRYRQHHQGLPVFGKWVTVRVDPHGSVRAAAVDVARGLTVSTQPAVDEAQALAVVAARLAKPLTQQQARFDLGVLPYEAQGGILAWHVDVIMAHGMHRFVVDAQTGGIIHDYSLAHDALGRVYPVNPMATPSLEDEVLTNLDPVDPDDPEATMTLTGYDGALNVYGYASGDINSGDIEGTQTGPSSGEDFLYDPNPVATSLDDPFNEVMAYYHASRMRNYFEGTFGLDMSSSDYGLAVVTSYAPSSSPEYIMNAFYSPWMPGYPAFPGYAKNIICLGRGQGEDFTHDSDVLLHEFTHYISQNAMSYADMGYYDQYGMAVMSGAINEGTADYFSSTLNDDAVVGEYALGGYARNLAASTGKCPDDVYGESHEDGKLIGSAGWAIREALGEETADQLMWGALTMLGSGAALGDFAEGLLQTAEDMNLDSGQVDTIESILAERGLDDCKRAIELNGKPRKSFLAGLDMIAQYMGASCNQAKNYGIYLSSIFQFVYTPDPQDTSVQIDIDLTTMQGGGELDWNVYVRMDDLVTFNPGQGYQPPSVMDYDFAFEGQTGDHVSVVLDDKSLPAFDTNTRYHVVIWHQNCATTSATVEATATKDEAAVDGGVVETDAGTVDSGQPPYDGGVAGSGGGGGDGGEGEDAGPTTDLAADMDPGGGCGCRTEGTSGSAPAGGLLALLAGVWLRRRRR